MCLHSSFCCYSLRLATEGWPGWIDLGGWLHTEMVHPPADIHVLLTQYLFMQYQTVSNSPGPTQPGHTSETSSYGTLKWHHTNDRRDREEIKTLLPIPNYLNSLQVHRNEDQKKIPKEHVMFNCTPPESLGQLFGCKSTLGDSAAVYWATTSLTHSTHTHTVLVNALFRFKSIQMQ